MQALPLFYYPSTVAWVDDDSLFLQAAAETFKNRLLLTTYNSPTKCLHSFKNYSPFLQKANLLHGRTDSDDYETINHLPVDINCEAFIQLIDKSEKKDEVSVMIIDYQMPEMTGIELCRHLKNIPTKKILLTGEADDSLAISAFNEGIINCFIKKESPTLMKDLTQHINTLSDEYFFEQSKGLLAHLEIDNEIPLSDPIFYTFFKNWCNDNNIKEHYIFDKHGNLLVVDDKGNKSCFVIHTGNTLNTFTELYKDNTDLHRFIESVNNRQQLPFFGIGYEGWQYSHDDWKNHFYPPKILQGREKYYWFTKAI